MLYRQDLARITLSLYDQRTRSFPQISLAADRGWTSCYGGKAIDGGYTDLVLKRVHSDEFLPELVRYANAVPSLALVRIEHLDTDAEVNGYGLAYAGTLTEVAPAPWDANGSDVSFDRVTVKPTRLEALLPTGAST